MQNRKGNLSVVGTVRLTQFLFHLRSRPPFLSLSPRHRLHGSVCAALRGSVESPSSSRRKWMGTIFWSLQRHFHCQNLCALDSGVQSDHGSVIGSAAHRGTLTVVHRSVFAFRGVSLCQFALQKELPQLQSLSHAHRSFGDSSGLVFWRNAVHQNQSHWINRHFPLRCSFAVHHYLRNRSVGKTLGQQEEFQSYEFLRRQRKSQKDPKQGKRRRVKPGESITSKQRSCVPSSDGRRKLCCDER